MKTVASFIEAYQAHILRGRLNSEGIPALVVDDQTATINWMYSQAIGGVKVTVPDEYYEQARSIAMGRAKNRAPHSGALYIDSGDRRSPLIWMTFCQATITDDKTRTINLISAYWLTH